MQALENRIPPPLVATLFALVMWPLASVLPGIAVGEPLRLAATAGVLLLGAFFCLAGVVSFRRARTTVNPLKPQTASALVSSGIYRISRNPMYLGFALFLVAWTLFLASPWALVGVLGFVLYMNRLQITPEERALAALFGAEYERYRSSVRRWL
ncbi:MAG: isoprenylcysteine carboxylmethyltransferase family protein [Pseudomonas sp.]|jgi:protein-S-isoprenylcysteine O-methyltransferase Ste14|nr:isoprenylcysteine carboxylmethyltransferase family protein [Pseudomonas sp.]